MPAENERADDGGLPEWVVADLFAAPTRERILCRLRRADGPVLLCDIVAELAASSAETRREVRMTLFQEHLPKLTATGAVEFDSARGTLSPGGAADALAPRLTDCPEAPLQDRV
ncbi:DUF7344 domain-containing protein [Halorientalis marina]|jgi:hypothetical protein|uniref:DUF7344 domain-containing protein n=1 Tax=Halorientalis marina TaxID=2931976 RepID=UPI001FF2A8F5|nr:hypothetical protein [Halorientalis marina]